MMTNNCTAFVGTRRIASGTLAHVASESRAAIGRSEWAQPLIFDDVTGHVIDVDLRGIAPPAQMTAATDETRRPGRPKLGVVAREVTLLPRHWDWLATQPGGASVALRKLVEHARRANQGLDRQRQAMEAAYRFLSAMAGNEPGFEEAARALFAGNRVKFDGLVETWPVDVRDHARKFASAAFEAQEQPDAAP